MTWLFQRGGEKLKYEIRRRENGRGYLLVMTEPNGQRKIEEVDQPTELIERSVEQMRQLHADGWTIS